MRHYSLHTPEEEVVMRYLMDHAREGFGVALLLCMLAVERFFRKQAVR
ncbi:hypothetical protein GLUCOINTEAF2_0202446 [Komagataeibacter intermedius AF2]|uniref:Uncharacterized protein n=1 Tax=Komagataeibacter intermedius AF2 TaxID=1458464 RepID=A0A0N0MEV2_9PROT|nr:hypothetical protein GLUCOINTEAF2_0202446 [Komagataeibacter intermedius AF2]